jgi:hypothetical protein
MGREVKTVNLTIRKPGAYSENLEEMPNKQPSGVATSAVQSLLQ